jgi:cell wall assembly regulator SMI1
MQAWERIETWLGSNAPDLLGALYPPASGEAFRKLEHGTQLTLPADARACWFRHDGQLKDAPPVLGKWWILRLDTVHRAWSDLRELQPTFDAADGSIRPVGPVRKRYFNPRWLPAMYDGLGNFLCLDLDPGPGGRRGQVVWFQKQDKRREVVANGIGPWLERFAGELERGKWQRSDDGVLIVARP